MDEFKGNSDALRSSNSLESAKKERRIEKVGDGKIVKKKTGLKDLTDGFFQEDVGAVRTYIWRDVLIPALKKTLWEMITGSADMFLYGGESAPRKRNLDKVSWRDNVPTRNTERRSTERIKSGYSFDNVLFPTRQEAEAAVESLMAAIEQYGNVSVSDMYSTAGITGEYTDCKYGWTDIRGVTIIRYEEGYLLKMPKAVPLT